VREEGHDTKHASFGKRTRTAFDRGIPNTNSAESAHAYEECEVLAAVQRQAAPILVNGTGIASYRRIDLASDAATVEAANKRRSYAVQPVDATSLSEQQRIADVFTQQSIIPKNVVVNESPVWKRS